MSAKKRGEMHESVEFYLSEILDGQREFRGDIKDLAKAVAEDAGDIGSLRKDVDLLIETVGTDGRNGLVEAMRSFRNSLDMQLVNTKPPRHIDPKMVAQWVGIGAGVIAYIVEILLPLWRL